MNCAILAVVFAIGQAVTPVPRQAPDSSATRSQNVQENPKGQQPPAAPSTVQLSGAAGINQDARHYPSETNKQNTVVIREPVSVTVRTSWWEIFYVIFTGCLVIVGALGVSFALRTLGAVEEQTATAKRNIDLLIATERARVVVELIPLSHRDESKQWCNEDGTPLDAGDIIRGKHCMYCLRVVNLGRTPAHLFDYKVNYGPLIEGSPFSPGTLEGSVFVKLNTFLAGGERRSLEDEINMRGIFPHTVKAGAFCITVKYGDIVTGKEEHVTFVHYHYHGADSSLERVAVDDRYT